MGMTATAVYILLVILLGPGLIQAGIEPIAAHMFIFYFGMMSFITPPICIAVYVAAGIAKANPLRTAVKAVLLGISGYIVPFIFVFEPQLLFIGSWPAVLSTFIFVGLGLFCCSVGFVGYLWRGVKPLERIFFGLVGLLFILPGLESRVIGLIALAVWGGVLTVKKFKKGHLGYPEDMESASSRASNL